MKPYNLDSAPSEHVRRIKSAMRLNAQSRARCRRLASVLYALRIEGIKLSDDSPTRAAYRVACSQRTASSLLLRRLQNAYKARHGHFYRNARLNFSASGTNERRP